MEYTSPYAEPTMTRSSITAGFERTWLTSGKPKAQASSRFGRSAAVSPARAASAKPVSPPPPPQPDQCTTPSSRGALAQKAEDGRRVSTSVSPVSHSATARRSSGVRSSPCRRMRPPSSELRTARGVIAPSVVRPGARTVRCPE